MATGYVHTVYKDGEWVNSVEGDGDVGQAYATKDAAVAAGRAEAQSRTTEHVIHNQDGTISERHSYGNDPAHRPG
jgi:hypothetical protein